MQSKHRSISSHTIEVCHEQHCVEDAISRLNQQSCRRRQRWWWCTETNNSCRWHTWSMYHFSQCVDEQDRERMCEKILKRRKQAVTKTNSPSFSALLVELSVFLIYLVKKDRNASSHMRQWIKTKRGNCRIKSSRSTYIDRTGPPFSHIQSAHAKNGGKQRELALLFLGVDLGGAFHTHHSLVEESDIRLLLYLERRAYPSSCSLRFFHR